MWSWLVLNDLNIRLSCKIMLTAEGQDSRVSTAAQILCKPLMSRWDFQAKDMCWVSFFRRRFAVLLSVMTVLPRLMLSCIQFQMTYFRRRLFIHHRNRRVHERERVSFWHFCASVFPHFPQCTVHFLTTHILSVKIVSKCLLQKPIKAKHFSCMEALKPPLMA